MSDSVLVGIASIPERVASLERTIASLAPQADVISLSLNDYEQIPEFLAAYPNVEATLRPGANGGDAEKFAAIDGWDGIVATCDDDLLYPPDYIATLVAGLDRHGRDRIVGFHGGKTLGWTGAALAATHKQIRCLGTLDADDADVNVLGTGAMAFHTAHVPLWRGVFRHPNMADVQLACHAHVFAIPMVALAHKAKWLTNICPDSGRRIYESNKRRDGSACDTTELRKAEMDRHDWATPNDRPHVRVSIATCDRPKQLLELLADLDRAAGTARLDVAVYEDHSDADYAAARAFCRERRWTWHRFTERLGRVKHWQLVDRELSDAESSDAGWFLFLPDDVRLVPHAIPRAIDTWLRLDDPATLTLWRLRALEGLANWTGKQAVQHDEASEIFHVDGLYLCQRPTLETLGYRCPKPARKRSAAMRSSGVGRIISLTLHGAGKRMYRVDRSLVICNDGGRSVMNPAERTRNPAVAL